MNIYIIYMYIKYEKPMKSFEESITMIHNPESITLGPETEN